MLSKMNGGEVIGFVAVLGGMAISVAAVLGWAWTEVRGGECRTRQFELETDLKRDMLNRGMSADEIERVLRAGKAETAPRSADAVSSA
jgi:hypothetical protein